jgi:hypothetical protein
MQNRRKLIIDRLQRHLPKKPRAELVIDIHINTPLRLYCLPLDEIFKSCDIITIVVRKNMDVNEPERLSNIILRHKFNMMSGTMMTVFVRLLHSYFSYC